LPTDIYSTLPIAYTAKHTNYETVDELRLIYGMNLDYLYGEDANLNGILDPNENDGDDLPPHDNKDSRLDSGILDFVTVWTHEPNVISNGISRVAVTDLTTLSNFFATNFPALKPTWSAFATTPPTNVLDFYVRSQMSASDFQEAEPFLMNAQTNGLVNVNTATATALSCVLNSTNLAAQILNYRQSTPPVVASITWVKDAVGSDQTTINEIGQYLTAFTFQYTADVAAVGHNGRGYRRVRFVFDTSSGVPQIIYRQDLTHLGWALGKTVRDELALNN
ncbi:MAG TPA: hypothetical protein VHB20_19085, partial [Verrucomicrobiae bacterium]|nr:hypothetical protein [Verrucomicrobiae bacterium]